jgi:hypothetical protein
MKSRGKKQTIIIRLFAETNDRRKSVVCLYAFVCKFQRLGAYSKTQALLIASPTHLIPPLFSTFLLLTKVGITFSTSLQFLTFTRGDTDVAPSLFAKGNIAGTSPLSLFFPKPRSSVVQMDASTSWTCSTLTLVDNEGDDIL